MDKDRAQKIADAYCSKHHEYRHAVYGGKFDGGFLFSLDFNGSGHHGTPLFVVVKNNGSTDFIEKESAAFYKAWHSSNDYFDGLNT